MSSDKKVRKKVQAAAAAALQQGPVKYQKVRLVLTGVMWQAWCHKPI
jgi:hypothetical protein